MSPRPSRKVILTPPQVAFLTRQASKSGAGTATASQQKARALLALASGEPVKAVAARFNRTPQTVYNWRRQFDRQGTAFLTPPKDSRQGVPISPEQIRQVLRLSRDIHFPRTAREIARETGISQATVCKLWKQHGITPPRQVAFAQRQQAVAIKNTINTNSVPAIAEGDIDTDSAATGRPAGIRDVARRAGVSASTASIVLRDLKGVAPATRERVTQAARELDYRPHPFHSALMAHIHQGRYRHIQATMAWLHVGAISFAETCKLPYGPRRRFAAARQRAQELGYRLEPFSLRHPTQTLDQLIRIWRHRGVFGVLLDFPGSDIDRIVPHLRDFALASLGPFADQNIDVVKEDVYSDTLHLYGRLWHLGYRRIGFCFNHDVEKSQHYQSTAAYQFLNYQMLPPAARVPPLMPDREARALLPRLSGYSRHSRHSGHPGESRHSRARGQSCHAAESPFAQTDPDCTVSGWDSDEFEPSEWVEEIPAKQLQAAVDYRQTPEEHQRALERLLTTAWLQRFRPEVVITNPLILPALRQLTLTVPADIGLAHRNLNTDVAGWTGIRKNDEAIGKAAVELLARAIEKGETAPQAEPRIISFQGIWKEGRTTRTGATPIRQDSPAQTRWLLDLARISAKEESRQPKKGEIER